MKRAAIVVNFIAVAVGEANALSFIVAEPTSGAASHAKEFGNPYSFADVAGVPYIYASDMDGSMIDAFGSASTSSRATLSLSEASLQGDDQVKACTIGSGFNDPENPPCARLVLSGNLSKVAGGSAEETSAKAALFAKHPSFKNFPPGHAFYVAKLDIDGLWLIDTYGGAANPDPADYFAYNSTVAA